MLLLLLNPAGKSVAKYIDTSLDWADNNEKWNSQKIRPDDKVLKGNTALSLDTKESIIEKTCSPENLL